MWKQNKKLVEYPYCGKICFYKDWAEFEKHKEDYPEHFKNPQKRFNAILKKYKKVNFRS